MDVQLPRTRANPECFYVLYNLDAGRRHRVAHPKAMSREARDVVVTAAGQMREGDIGETRRHALFFSQRPVAGLWRRELISLNPIFGRKTTVCVEAAF